MWYNIKKNECEVLLMNYSIEKREEVSGNPDEEDPGNEQ